MNANDIKSSMIRIALNKGFSDFKRNPDRTIRNLVDLGSTLSSGRHQKDFFDRVIDLLKNKKSAYYALFVDVVEHTNQEHLVTFGINLGYHALSRGAGAIRQSEELEGYNIPWLLRFDLEEDVSITQSHISGFLRQAKALGIYCAVFSLGANDFWDDFLAIAAKEKDMAFFLLISSSSLTKERCIQIVEKKNICTFVQVDRNDPGTKDILHMLRDTGCLYGGYVEEANISVPFERFATSLFDEYGIPFLAIHEKKRHPARDALYQSALRFRSDPGVPILPLDLYNDVAAIDRSISSEACLFFANSSGGVVIDDLEAGITQFCGYIQNMTLRDMLQKLPKKITAFPQEV